MKTAELEKELKTGYFAKNMQEIVNLLLQEECLSRFPNDCYEIFLTNIAEEKLLEIYDSYFSKQPLNTGEDLKAFLAYSYYLSQYYAAHNNEEKALTFLIENIKPILNAYPNQLMNFREAVKQKNKELTDIVDDVEITGEQEGNHDEL